jgi:hypothetical protein
MSIEFTISKENLCKLGEKPSICNQSNSTNAELNMEELVSDFWNMHISFLQSSKILMKSQYKLLAFQRGEGIKNMRYSESILDSKDYHHLVQSQTSQKIWFHHGLTKNVLEIRYISAVTKPKRTQNWIRMKNGGTDKGMKNICG